MTRRGRHVLVIEDDADGADALRALLELGGHRVEVARSGAEGIAAALASRPEVVVLDLGLPDVDGCDALRQIRAGTGDVRPFIVAYSGYHMLEESARAAGCDAFIVKPDVAAIEEVIDGAG